MSRGQAAEHAPIGRGLACSSGQALRGAYREGRVEFAPLLLAGSWFRCLTKTMQYKAKLSGSVLHKTIRYLALIPVVVMLATSGCGKSGSKQARAKLLELGYEYSPEVFVMCAGKGDENAVKLFLDSGMPLSAKSPDKDPTGMDALFAACLTGQESVARLLLERGADPNATSLEHHTPLAAAAGKGNTGVVALLLTKGARIDTPGTAGLTPLMLAASNTKEATAKLLIEKGAAVDATDPAGLTALMQAATYNQTGIIKALLAAHADVNKLNKEGRTALMHATFRGNVEAATLLIENHARADLKDSTGKTALDYADGDVVTVLKAAIQQTK